MGHLGADPEMKTLPNGNSVTNVRLATTTKFKKDGEWQKRPEWHDVTIWGLQATWCAERLSKGSLLMVEGRIETQSWDDKNGEKKYRTKIIADQVHMFDKRGAAGEPEFSSPAPSSQPNFSPPDDDDIPF